MNLLKHLIIILVIFSSTFCQIDTEAQEFEENEINSDFQQFIFKTSKPSKIILIIKNGNLNQNSNDTKTLTTFNKVNKKIEEFNLYYTIGYVILEEDDQTEENVEYILRFKNYDGGKFIIYNSANDYPLKYLEKGYNLNYYFPTSGRRDVKLTFSTEILKNDVLLDVFPGEKIKIIKILDPDVEEPLEIKNNSAYLPKDSKYKIEFNENGINGFGVAIKKREVINYKINDEIKLDLFKGIPYFFLLKVSEFDTDMIYTFMYCASYTWYNISIFELDSDRVDNWDNIEFNDMKRLYSGYINEINTTKLEKDYLLIKYALSSTSISYANYHYFYKFKIFQSFQSSTPLIVDKIEKPKLIIQQKDYRYLMFTSSNISNLRSFEDNETKNFIIKGLSEYFSYIISPTSEPSKLNYFTIRDYHFKWNIYYKEKFFRNDLNSLFDNLDEKSIWYFDINDSYTFIVKSYFGFPKIYYINEMTEDNIDNLRNERFDNFTQINAINNIMNVNGPFALYIEPYENAYLNMLLNKDDNLNILKEIPNKYLIANKEYQLLAPNKLMVGVDEDFDSNINILENDKIISTLNKENIFFEIEPSYGNLIIKSEVNAIINMYYNISDLFFDETIDIITFPPEKIGEIMIVKILSFEEKNYYYAEDYGYDYYISPSTKRITTKQAYFFIEDPYSKMPEKNQNLRYHLILFNKNIKYEISFKKKYEKQNNLPYYIIESDDNYGFVSEFNYPKLSYNYELLLCENKDMNLTRIGIDNSTESFQINKSIIKRHSYKSLFTFKANSKFIFLTNTNNAHYDEDTEIKYYLPNIENGKIFLLIENYHSYAPYEYTLVLVEDNNNDDKLMDALDNECYFFSLINGEIDGINYITYKDSIEEGKYFYKELDYTQFSNSKYLLIKFFSREYKDGVYTFSKTKRIYLENLKKDEEEEFGVKKIEEFTEYKITRQEYIFSYDYKTYLNNIEDLMIYITVPLTENGYVGEFEVINPLMQNFTFKYRYTETIALIKGQHVPSSGRYYFIFRNNVGVTFYLHNTIRFFPLNKINNYISETSHKISNGLIYFTMNLEEDKYVYLDHNLKNLYLYNISNKAIETISSTLYSAYKIKKGSYVIILDYSDYTPYQIMININHYIVDLEKSKEIKSEIGTKLITQPTVCAVVNLSKYNNSLYLVSDSLHLRVISCEKTMDIDDIVKNNWSGYSRLKSHIFKITDEEQCDPPYYNIRFQTARFELVSDVYNINTSQNLTFQHNDTVAFTVEGNGYNLILSTQENMKWLDIMETEFVDIILSNEHIQFKLKPNESIQTDLQIIILDNEKNIKIEDLTNKEISTKIKYNNENEEIKYYINLSKNKYIINHYDYIGKLEFYISKDEINGYNLGEILKANEINMDLFEKVTNDNFELDNKKILAMKKVNHIYSDLLMTPIIHDFILENVNSKYLIANKRYFIRSYLKIILDENSDAKIKVYDLNNTEIYTIDKDNSFENKDYNNLLFLSTDKNAIIYIYHYKEENLKIIEHPKDINNTILILSSSDCENNNLEYTSDFGFKNYYSYNLELTKLSNSKTFISLAEDSDIKIPKGQSYITYIQCENKAQLLGNTSGFYNYTTSKEGNASYIMEKNKDIFIRNNLDENKKNIFYQIFECEPDTISNNEIDASIDGNGLNRLDENDNYIKGQNSIYFYLKTNDEFLFNYYKTSSDKNKYDSIEKNNYPDFQINYLSKNKAKIDIIPKYININFDFYFFMYIDKENTMTYNPFQNKCYMKKLMKNDKNKLNDENIIIKKIEYKNGEIVNNIIETPNLEKGFSIYSNIFGSGNIFEDVEEYIFYNEQKHIIEDSDYPSDTPPSDQSGSDVTPQPSNKGGLTGGAIAGIVIGAVAFILIIVFLVLKFRKKDSLNLENDNKYTPLTIENNN